MYKEKQTKNVLTHDVIKKELQQRTKAEIYMATIKLAIASLFLIPCIALGIYLAKPLLLLGIAMVAVCVSFIAYVLYGLISRIRVARLIGRDGFSVVTDTLCRTAKETHGSSRTYYTVTVYYLTEHGKVPTHIGMGDADIGDAFYVVELADKKKSVLRTYPTATYEYVDEKKEEK